MHLYIRDTDHAAYLRYIFASPEGAVNVSRTHTIGKLIYAHRSTSELPVPVPAWASEYNAVPVILPATSYCKPDAKFSYMTREAVEAVNDGIKAYFDIYFERYMIEVQAFRFEKKEAIEAFIIEHGIAFCDTSFEKYKKKDYRKWQAAQQKVVTKYRHRDIRKTRETYAIIEKAMKAVK